MRLGENPGKTEPELPPLARHRIVVPVHIRDDDYYARAGAILETCLDSLAATTPAGTPVTVVSDASNRPTVEALTERYGRGDIDELVLARTNRGKVDAVLAGARSNHEELVTFADGDVYFLPGWLEAVEQLFAAFPEAGAVSPHPAPQLARYCTSSTLLDAGRRRELGVASVADLTALDEFAASVGNPALGAASHATQLVVRRGAAVACVGAGHFCITVRRAALAAVPTARVGMRIGGEQRWLDEPIDAEGWWRLSTPDRYVLHLGNAGTPPAEPAPNRLGARPADLRPHGRPWPRRVPTRLRRRLGRLMADRAR